MKGKRSTILSGLWKDDLGFTLLCFNFVNIGKVFHRSVVVMPYSAHLAILKANVLIVYIQHRYCMLTLSIHCRIRNWPRVSFSPCKYVILLFSGCQRYEILAQPFPLVRFNLMNIKRMLFASWCVRMTLNVALDMRKRPWFPFFLNRKSTSDFMHMCVNVCFVM